MLLDKDVADAIVVVGSTCNDRREEKENLKMFMVIRNKEEVSYLVLVVTEDVVVKVTMLGVVKDLDKVVVERKVIS